MIAKKITENEERIWKRSTTPQARLHASESFACLTDSRSGTPSRRNFAAERYHARSTVFDAAIEQSSIDQGLSTPRRQRLNLSRSPTKLRETRTFSSTVFLPPDPIVPTVSQFKPKDHSTHDLFGKEEIEFYSKRNTIPGYVPNFQPKYKEINPTSTKNEDMYGKAADYCIPKSELEELPPSNLTAKDNYIRRPSPDREVSPKIRKSLDAISQVFPKNETQHTVRFRLEECGESPNRIVRKSVDVLRENSQANQIRPIENKTETRDLRKSAEIFREEKPRVRLIQKSREAETSRNSRNNTKENLESPREQIKLISKPRSQTPTQRSVPILNITPKLLKMRELNVPNIEVPKEDSKYETFDLTGLPPSYDERSIRDLCKGVQIVNITPNINNITGECTGSAQISLRYQPQYKSFENLQLNCLEKGLTLSSTKKDVGKRNNYAELSNRKFLDNFLKAEEKKIVDKYATPRGYRPDLMSSDDIYGSSPGVGRMSYCTPIKTDGLRASLDSWRKVKNVTSKTAVRSLSRGSANFMRGTISSCNKTKQI